ncbi:UNVERIFIED_CONTAM: hypothetical protein PYX00_008549 [Menopon gallinae]|uniref:Gustatory receptor n=1 Tax=Menopon gallinae TaxID=328185 RepID=A0AAW2HPM0_9NEOP
MGHLPVGDNIIAFASLSGILPTGRDGRIRRKFVYCNRCLLLVAFGLQFCVVYAHHSLLEHYELKHSIAFYSTYLYCLSSFVSLAVVHCHSGTISGVLKVIAKSSTHVRRSPCDDPLLTLLLWNFTFMEILLVAYTGRSLFRSSDGQSLLPFFIMFTANHIIFCIDYVFVVLVLNCYVLLESSNDSLSLARADDVQKCASHLRHFYSEYLTILDAISACNDCFSLINLISLSFSASAITCSVFFLVSRVAAENDFIHLIDVIYAVYFFSDKTLASLITARKYTEQYRLRKICTILNRILDTWDGYLESQLEGAWILRPVNWTYILLELLSVSHGIRSLIELRAVDVDRASSILQSLYVDIADSSIQNEVEILKLLLHHRKVEFDACGFFKMDFSILLCMISTTTTYIIILVQLEYAPVDCTKCNSTLIN